MENAAEQRALRRAGFRCEGVLSTHWRAGSYPDAQSWSRLRTDA